VQFFGNLVLEAVRIEPRSSRVHGGRAIPSRQSPRSLFENVAGESRPVGTREPRQLAGSPQLAWSCEVLVFCEFDVQGKFQVTSESPRQLRDVFQPFDPAGCHQPVFRPRWIDPTPRIPPTPRSACSAVNCGRTTVFRRAGCSH
jgi:hypothetical protein